MLSFGKLSSFASYFLALEPGNQERSSFDIEEQQIMCKAELVNLTCWSSQLSFYCALVVLLISLTRILHLSLSVSVVLRHCFWHVLLLLLIITGQE